jgi:hypothetical protein
MGRTSPTCRSLRLPTCRGRVRVLDRAQLKRRSCECYQRLQDHFEAVIGESGRGAEAS